MSAMALVAACSGQTPPPEAPAEPATSDAPPMDATEAAAEADSEAEAPVEATAEAGNSEPAEPPKEALSPFLQSLD